ncbi:MAG: purine-binding chemotaxis protein CheW [Candidatus Lindowbacteria bacterium]|nr:purine-binding chemotaxis protein CheW [Candidatus Lindowbacteria bacterium]
MPDPEEMRKILAARANALARKPKQTKDEGKRIEIVEFLVAHEHYGIESSFAGKVYPLQELTPLPCTPPFVCGIVNVRGQIVSVIDLKKFFELPEKGLTDLNRFIVVRNHKMEFGILVDDVIGIRNIPLAGIQQALPTLTGIREKYLKGVTDEQVVILDANKLLSDKGIIVNEEVD